MSRSLERVVRPLVLMWKDTYAKFQFEQVKDRTP